MPILSIAFVICSVLTESYPFFISWKTIHNGFLYMFECSTSTLMIWMDAAVDVFFSTEKLSPFSMLCLLHVSDILALRILVRIFLVVLISIIGLMFIRFP